MKNVTPHKDPAAEQLVHQIEEHAARLRKSLALIDQSIARDEVARRDEADRLRRYVDAVLAKVAILETQVTHGLGRRDVKATVVMRVGQALATTINPPGPSGSAPR